MTKPKPKHMHKKRGHPKDQPNAPLFEKDMDAIADLLQKPDFYSCEVEDTGEDGELRRIGGEVTYNYRKAIKQRGTVERTGEEAMRGRYRRNFHRKVASGKVALDNEGKPIAGPRVAEERLDDAFVRHARNARGGSRYLTDIWRKERTGGC